MQQHRFDKTPIELYPYIYICINTGICTRSTRMRRGGSCHAFLGLYVRPVSSIELACAVCQPGPCVRALCNSDALFQRSHLKLHTSHCTLHTSHFALHTPHFISSHLKLPTCRLHTQPTKNTSGTYMSKGNLLETSKGLDDTYTLCTKAFAGLDATL